MEDRPAELVCPCAGHGINYAAGCPAIWGRRILCDHGKLLDGVNSETKAENARWAATCIVCYIDSVEFEAGRLRPRAADRHHEAQAAVTASIAERHRVLRANNRDPRLQGRERRPIAAIQRKISNHITRAFTA